MAVSNYGVLAVCQALRQSHVNLPCDPAQGGGPTFPFGEIEIWDTILPVRRKLGFQARTDASTMRKKYPVSSYWFWLWYAQFGVSFLPFCIFGRPRKEGEFTPTWKEAEKESWTGLQGAGLASSLPCGPEPALALWARFTCVCMAAVPS